MISKNDVKVIHQQISAAVAVVLKANGYKLGKDSCRYSEFDMKFTIEALRDDANAMAERARQMFRFSFEEYGVDYGTVVTDPKGARKFSVDGFNRAGKMGAKDLADGRVYYGKPEVFYLNGKPLQSKFDRELVELEARKKVTIATRPVCPAPKA